MSSRPLPEPPSPNHHNQSHHQLHQQGHQNGYISSGETKSPDHMTNGTSHHTAKNRGRPLPDPEQPVLTEDIFYNFGDLGQGFGGPISPGMFDPNDPGSIPFSDIPAMQGEEFNQDLFESILSSGTDILARLDSAASSEGGGADQVLAIPSDGTHVEGMNVCVHVCKHRYFFLQSYEGERGGGSGINFMVFVVSRTCKKIFFPKRGILQQKKYSTKILALQVSHSLCSFLEA